MEYVGKLADILISSYLISTLANLAFSQGVFKLEFSQIQNWLGLTLLLGLGLYYLSAIGCYLLADTAEMQSLLPLKNWNEHFFFNLMHVYPLVMMGLCVSRTLRIKKVVVLLSTLMFAPRLLEFLIVFSTSEVTIWTMNSIYTGPIFEILLGGPLLYVAMILVSKRNAAANND